MPAVDAGIRVVQMRIGIVLSPDGGALKQMLPPFRLGLGGQAAALVRAARPPLLRRDGREDDEHHDDGEQNHGSHGGTVLEESPVGLFAGRHRHSRDACLFVGS